MRDTRNVNTMMEQKEFFSTLYHPLIEPGNNLTSGEHFRVLQINDKGQSAYYFNNLDTMIDHVSSNKTRGVNTYFSLATTTGESGRTEDLKTRTFIALDFDKKDIPGLDIDEIQARYNKIKLWYHAIIDSGNGYHVYTLIEPTQNLELVEDITNKLAKDLGADSKATLKTQILRVPGTWNIKDKARPKRVNRVHLYTENLRPYTLEQLYKKLEPTGSDLRTHKRLDNSIKELLETGSPEGVRNRDLTSIVTSLREQGHTLSQVQEIVKPWADKSNYKDSLEYRVAYIFKHMKVGLYQTPVYAIEFPQEHGIIELSESHTSGLKDRKRGRVMGGNDLLIYTLLVNYRDGLTREEITEELTFKGETRLGRDTIHKSLKSLEKNGYIKASTMERGRKLYQVSPMNNRYNYYYQVSLASTFACIKGEISTEELRLYLYMRYLHSKQQREDSRALPGNLFFYRQVDLAKDLGVTQVRVSQMVKNLLEYKLLGIWRRVPTEWRKNIEYNIYTLNY